MTYAQTLPGWVQHPALAAQVSSMMCFCLPQDGLTPQWPCSASKCARYHSESVAGGTCACPGADSQGSLWGQPALSLQGLFANRSATPPHLSHFSCLRQAGAALDSGNCLIVTNDDLGSCLHCWLNAEAASWCLPGAISADGSVYTVSSRQGAG